MKLEETFKIDLNISKDQQKAFNDYWEHGKNTNDNILTKKQNELIPNLIDGIKLNNNDKYNLVSNSLDFPSEGLSYRLNENGNIVKNQLDEETNPMVSLLKNSDVKYDASLLKDQEYTSSVKHELETHDLKYLNESELSKLSNNQLNDYNNKLMENYLGLGNLASSWNPNEMTAEENKRLSIVHESVKSFENEVINRAVDFHLNNNYKGKINNLTAYGLKNPLIKAFRENTGLEIGLPDLKEIDKKVDMKLGRDQNNGLSY